MRPTINREAKARYGQIASERLLTKEERNDVIRIYMDDVPRIAFSMSQKYKLDPDEALSIGYLKLVEGVNSFTPYMTSALTVYITSKIQHGIVHECTQSVRFEPTEADDLAQQIDMWYETDDCMEYVFAKQRRTAIDEALLSESLTKRENLVLRLRYFYYEDETLTHEQVAKILGVSRERVRQIELKAIRKLKATHNIKMLEQYYLEGEQGE